MTTSPVERPVSHEREPRARLFTTFVETRCAPNRTASFNVDPKVSVNALAPVHRVDYTRDAFRSPSERGDGDKDTIRIWMIELVRTQVSTNAQGGRPYESIVCVGGVMYTEVRQPGGTTRTSFQVYEHGSFRERDYSPDAAVGLIKTIAELEESGLVRPGTTKQP